MSSINLKHRNVKDIQHLPAGRYHGILIGNKGKNYLICEDGSLIEVKGPFIIEGKEKV